MRSTASYELGFSFYLTPLSQTLRTALSVPRMPKLAVFAVRERRCGNLAVGGVIEVSSRVRHWLLGGSDGRPG